ncbi:hypothetical protein L1987_03525 [Smallanthus sonchifolius]|uniref:Uncharacterized protein n=1 Tax=Smallanthus sonchifolius TaxID=185202 RepID=A0ACB9KAX6_9ASTR|nr:hypothetical protein L1987_03525 [Smallanthus sonchifolius]
MQTIHTLGNALNQGTARGDKTRNEANCHNFRITEIVAAEKAGDGLNGKSTNDHYQLAAVALCLLSAWCSEKLGLDSLELGSFVAGVATDFAKHTLDQLYFYPALEC